MHWQRLWGFEAEFGHAETGFVYASKLFQAENGDLHPKETAPASKEIASQVLQLLSYRPSFPLLLQRSILNAFVAQGNGSILYLHNDMSNTSTLTAKVVFFY